MLPRLNPGPVTVAGEMCHAGTAGVGYGFVEHLAAGYLDATEIQTRRAGARKPGVAGVPETGVASVPVPAREIVDGVKTPPVAVLPVRVGYNLHPAACAASGQWCKGGSQAYALPGRDGHRQVRAAVAERAARTRWRA